MGSKAGNLLRVAAPLALNYFAPGLGSAIGGALGATTAAGASALGGGLLGAGTGLIGGGGLKGALIGGASGGLSGYAGAGGFNGTSLGRGLNAVGIGNPANITSNAFGAGAGGLLTNGASSASSGGGLGSLLGSSMGGGNTLGTAANLYSGIQGNATVKNAMRAQQDANNKALALQAKQYDQTSANMNPFLTAGQSANSQLSTLLGLSGGDPAARQTALEATPGYQFRLQQGTKSMNQSLGASGNLFSGSALKAAQQFGQGLADQTYNDQINNLTNLSNSGQNAAAHLGSAGANYANQASGLYGNAGDISANGAVARNNNTNQSLANILGSNVGGYSGGQGQIIGYDANGRPVYRGGGFY